MKGTHAARDVVHLDAADAGHDVEHRAHRRRDQADGVVDDEQHAEVDRVDAGGLDHRHQHRRQDQDGGRHVHRRAHVITSTMMAISSSVWLPMNGSQQRDHLRREIGHGDQPGADHRRGDQEHDHRSGLGRGDEHLVQLPPASARGTRSSVATNSAYTAATTAASVGVNTPMRQADQHDQRQHQGPGRLAQRAPDARPRLARRRLDAARCAPARPRSATGDAPMSRPGHDAGQEQLGDRHVGG